MTDIPGASQIMAALIKRLGGGPIVLTYAEIMAFETKWPTKFESDEAGTEITLSIAAQGEAATYFPSDYKR